MKEIEIKARLKDKEQVMAALSKRGCVFAPAVVQDDTVYARKVATLAEFRTNDAFLRLRVKDGKDVFFTVKKPMANDLDALEYEVEVSNRDEMEQALWLMGFQEAIRIRKTRIVTRHEGREICIDEVDGLGAFIEMEQLAHEGDSEKIQEEMFLFFQEIGINPEDRVLVGYDTLMYEARALL
jgi:adenylate cyclase, class 2